MMTLPERRRAVVRVFRAVPEETTLEYGRMGERIAETEGPLGTITAQTGAPTTAPQWFRFFPIVEQAFGKGRETRGSFHFQMITDSETVVKIGQQSALYWNDQLRMTTHKSIGEPDERQMSLPLSPVRKLRLPF